MNIPIKVAKGSHINTHFDQLAQLRIDIFHEYPYLYEGDLDYEKKYLQIYSSCDKAIMLYFENNNAIQGACTCIPMHEETQEFIDPIIKHTDINIDQAFYIGEILVRKEFRGIKLGKKLMEHAIVYIKTHFPQYHNIILCTVEREDRQDKKPVNYLKPDYFWRKYGFEKIPSLSMELEWRDIGDKEETSKKMSYWIKKLY